MLITSILSFPILSKFNVTDIEEDKLIYDMEQGAGDRVIKCSKRDHLRKLVRRYLIS